MTILVPDETTINPKVTVTEEADAIYILKMKTSSFVDATYRVLIAGEYEFNELYWSEIDNEYKTEIDSYRVKDLFSTPKSIICTEDFLLELEKLLIEYPNSTIHEIETSASYYEITGWHK